jgi:hypothetical protein
VLSPVFFVLLKNAGAIAISRGSAAFKGLSLKKGRLQQKRRLQLLSGMKLQWEPEKMGV